MLRTGLDTGWGVSPPAPSNAGLHKGWSVGIAPFVLVLHVLPRCRNQRTMTQTRT